MAHPLVSLIAPPRPRGALGRRRSVPAALATLLVASALTVFAAGSAPAGALNAGDSTTWIGGPGSGSAFGTAFYASDLAIDGNLVYIADGRSNVVRSFDRTTNTFGVVAGSVGTGPTTLGPATATPLPQVYAVAAFGGAVYLSTSAQILKVSGGMLSVVAGTTVGFAGDGGPATAAKLYRPSSLAFAPDGTLYFTDGGNNRIRKVATNGIITTIAGTGGNSFAGDGGQAVNAQFGSIGDLARDTTGNLFVVDAFRVRKIATNGIITTVAGNGSSGSSGDGGPATAANLLVYDIAADGGGNLLIATGVYNEIRKVTPGGTITTIAGGNGFGHTGDGGPAAAAKFLRAVSVAVDPAGGYLVGDSEGPGDGSWLRRVTAGGTISSIAGGTETTSSGSSTAGASQAASPNGLAVDANGTVYFADGGNSRVRKVTANGVISDFAGTGRYGWSGDNGPALSAKLDTPMGIAVDGSGTVYVSDTGVDRVRKIAPDGTITTVAGNGTAGYSGDGGPATNASLDGPNALAVDANGYLYIADTHNNRVRRVAPNGIITTFAGGPNGGVLGDGGPPASAFLLEPRGVAVDELGRVLIADTGHNRVRRVTGGIITTVAGGDGVGYAGDGGPATAATLWGPTGLAAAADGSFFIVDTTSNRVRKVDAFGTITTVAGSSSTDKFAGDGGPATAAALNNPLGVAVKRNGDLLISDTNNMRIRRVPGVADASVRFHSLAPTRILDSRTANGGWGGPLLAGEPNVKSLTVAGAGGGAIPAGITAVVMNVTVTQGTAGSFLTVYPKGGAVPTASNLNFAAGETIPNLVTVKLSPDGVASFFNAVGSVHVIADVVGYYDNGYDPTGASFTGITPSRILDSRTPLGGFNGPIGPGGAKDLVVTGVGGVAANASSVVLNVTVTEGTKGSFLTVYPTGAAKPNASNLNFAPNQTIANLVTAKVGAGGKITIANELGNAHVTADVVGYFATPPNATAGRFHPLAPIRILDDRNGTGGYSTPWGLNMIRSVAVAGANGIPAEAKSVVVNITATNGTAGSVLTAWPDGVAKPGTSTVVFGPGQTIPNLAAVKLGANGKLSIANELGTVDVIADVVGYYADH